MKDIALIDGDIVAFRCAATAENDPQEIAEIRCDELMRRILYETNAINYKCFLSGANNFRYDIYPEYKANRKGKPDPIWREACKEYLVKYWNAKITDGYEADDELGIEQTAHGLDSVICSIDKDLLQIPGYHYNFVRSEQYFISPYDGLRKFYGQLITGDASDNIPAFDGKFRSVTPKFVQKLLDPLQDMTDEVEMYKYVMSVWEDHFGNPLGFKHMQQIMHRNARCLWLMRKEGEIWQPPGQTNEDTTSSSECYVMEADDGPPNTKL